MTENRLNNPAAFIRESNRIEGILRQARKAEIQEHERFMSLGKVTIGDLVHFVKVYQPGARLRNQPGLDVRIGSHFPPPGGERIAYLLQAILDDANSNRSRDDAYRIHCDYEILHPFTDGNGRSGRMLWMWMMREAPLGFLHHFYYQALSNARVEE